MKLNLKNPLIFFDLETTGVDLVRDRIVEISILKVMPDGSEECKTRRINPERPIPPESTAIHGIRDEDVKDCPPFRSVAKSLAQWIEGCDLAGFNSTRFDVPMLVEEFLRAGVDIDLRHRKLIDVQTIFHKMEPRTLEAATRFYCNRTLENAHSAEADTRATYDVFKAQLDRYEGTLENDMAFLADFSASLATWTLPADWFMTTTITLSSISASIAAVKLWMYCVQIPVITAGSWMRILR